MLDWNVVITVRNDNFTRARQVLERFGAVKRTDFYNVLVMKVDDASAFPAQLADHVARKPDILQTIGRVMPASELFEFQNAETFETKAREAALRWAPRLAGRSFHVRMHRRGFKEALPSQQEERMLDHVLLDALERAGRPGRIEFEDPDLILEVETVGQRAGMSLWTREQLERYPFLNLD
jgi:tRNA(Ser,Leu) C12 N-acetylase TAN1